MEHIVGPGETPATVVEVKAKSIIRARLGRYSPDALPKGYQIEVLPKAMSSNSVKAQINCKDAADYTEFFIDLSNHSRRSITAKVTEII